MTSARRYRFSFRRDQFGGIDDINMENFFMNIDNAIRDNDVITHIFMKKGSIFPTVSTKIYADENGIAPNMGLVDFYVLLNGLTATAEKIRKEQEIGFLEEIDLYGLLDALMSTAKHRVLDIVSEWEDEDNAQTEA